MNESDVENVFKNVVWPITEQLNTLVVAAMNPDTTQPIYHYTSADGMKSIVESGTLRAGSIKYSNDAEEYEYGFRNIRTELESAANSNISLSALLRDVLIFLEKFDGNEIYACCLSERDDDLEQWRGYGAGGFGYSIGFDFKGLVATNQVEYERLGYAEPWAIYKVLYGNELLKSVIIEPFLSFCKNLNLPGEERELAAKCFAYMLSAYTPAFKHPSFIHEKEMRLTWGRNHLYPAATDRKPSFRIKNCMLYPYMEITPKTGRLPITSIRLGPCLNEKFALPSLRMFLDKNGYSKIPIDRSSVPYLP